MNSLEKAKKLLEPSHIYCSSIINVGVKENRLVGLSVECSPILMNDKMAFIKKIIGDEYVVTKFPNDGTIKITIK